MAIISLMWCSPAPELVGTEGVVFVHALFRSPSEFSLFWFKRALHLQLNRRNNKKENKKKR